MVRGRHVIPGTIRILPSDWAVSLQLADVVDNEAMQVYMKPSSHEESKTPSKGFVVRDAPWATVNNEKVSAAASTSLGTQGPLCRGLTLRSGPLLLVGETERSFLLWWQRKQWPLQGESRLVMPVQLPEHCCLLQMSYPH